MSIDTYVSDIKVLDYKSVSVIQQIFAIFFQNWCTRKLFLQDFKNFLAFNDFLRFYVETNKDPYFCHALTTSFTRDISELLWLNMFFSKEEERSLPLSTAGNVRKEGNVSPVNQLRK